MPPPIPMPVHPSLVYQLGDFLLYAGIPPIILFTALYFLRSNWRATAAGRAIMWLTSTMMVVLVLSAVTRFLGQDWPAREYVRLVAYFFVSMAIWRLFFLLVKVQFFESRAHEKEQAEKETTGTMESVWKENGRS